MKISGLLFIFLILALFVQKGYGAVPHGQWSSHPRFSELLQEEEYKKAIEAFRRKDIKTLEQVYLTLEKMDRRNFFNDRVLFLLGRLNLIQGKYVKSLEHFSTIEKKYPHSSKRVSVLFYKALVYKKLYLNNQARALFQKVQRQYPGSPEANRVPLELKLLKYGQKS